MNKIKTLASLCLAAVLLTGCVNDDGTYDYKTLADIKVENVPEKMELLSYVDHITVDPKIISSEEGEIKADNPNFTVEYKLGYKGMGALGGNDYEAMKSLPWVELKPTDGFKLDVPANYGSEQYVLWMMITDKRNNTVTDKLIDISIASTTSNGWLVYCNEGTDERVRLDMISQLTSTRIETIHDIISGMPTLHHATDLGFVAQMANPGDQFTAFSKEGAYMLDNEDFKSGEENEFKNATFASDPGTTIIREVPFSASTYDWQVRYRFAFDDQGNAYLKDQTSGGSVFGFPINALKAGGSAEFRVAPYVGFSMARPWSTSYKNNALFYDLDNKRFLGFLGNNAWDDAEQKMTPIAETSADQLFSFTTGKDFVYMESTRRSNGLVYTILQAADGSRSIYGINMSGAGFTPELYIDKVDAPDFDKATQFAFDSRFPLMFYAVDGKVYLYNMGTKTAKQLDLGLGSGEKVTLLKFNLFRNTDYNALVDHSEDFLAKQYKLIVATYDDTAEGVNNGKVRFYNVDGVNNSVSKDTEYTGFAKVVNVIYREQAN